MRSLFLISLSNVQRDMWQCVCYFSSLSATHHGSGDPSRALHYLNTHSRRPCNASERRSDVPFTRSLHTNGEEHFHQLDPPIMCFLFFFLPYIQLFAFLSDNVGITSMDTGMFSSSITKATVVKTWVWNKFLCDVTAASPDESHRNSTSPTPNKNATF